MGKSRMLHWLFVCLQLLAGVAMAQDGVNVTYTVVPQCTTDCVISAFSSGVASCQNALDTACTCEDTLYQEWLVDCVMANCTVKEQIISKNIESRQCHIPLKPKRWDILGAMYALFILASILMVVRVTVKLTGHGGGWGWDDWLILPAYAALVAMFGISIHVSEIAFGYNMWDIEFANIYRGLELFWIADQAYTALISLTKLSMCFFFLRIFGHSRSFRRLAYLVIAGNVVIFIVFQFMVAFQCRPVRAFWTFWTGEMDGEYYCFSLYSFALGQAVVSIVMDVIMISLPLHETMKVKLSIRKKVGVAVMFAMGFIWTIVGIVRSIAIWDTRVITNITIDMAPLGYWTVFEAAIAVICACVPDSRFFLSHLIPRTFGWSSTSKNSHCKSPFQLTDLSARPARMRAMRVRAGMISVTTEFDLKSTVDLNQASCERLTEGGGALPWEKPGMVTQEESGAYNGWPLRKPLPTRA